MTLTGESGDVASEELELGHRLWLRLENVEAIGEDPADDAPDELRECAEPDWYGDPGCDIVSSCFFGPLNLGKERERILLMLYTCFQRLPYRHPDIMGVVDDACTFRLRCGCDQAVSGATQLLSPRSDVLARVACLTASG